MLRNILTCCIASASAGGSSMNGGEYFDVKLARGLGARGYSSVRITVTERLSSSPSYSPSDTHADLDPKAFAYNAPFQHRWTDQTLHTVLVNATPGTENVYRIGTNASTGTISFFLPSEGASVRGVFFGDPCTEPGKKHAS